jgi:histidine triad (HIT) family protein
MVNTCVFCKIIARILPATVIAENDQLIVIKDIHPKAPIHYLIIPKIHVANINELEDSQKDLAGSMLLMAKKLAQDLPEPAFKLLINNGAQAGQVVFHLHTHFLAGARLAEF